MWPELEGQAKECGWRSEVIERLMSEDFFFIGIQDPLSCSKQESNMVKFTLERLFLVIAS